MYKAQWFTILGINNFGMNVGCLPLNMFVYISPFLSLLPSIQFNASNFLAISTHTVVTNLG